MYVINDKILKFQKKSLEMILGYAGYDARMKMAGRLDISDTSIPAIIAAWEKKLIPCQGRCPKQCLQGIDETTKENCTHCNGWGFVEAKL